MPFSSLFSRPVGLKVCSASTSPGIANYQTPLQTEGIKLWEMVPPCLITNYPCDSKALLKFENNSGQTYFYNHKHFLFFFFYSKPKCRLVNWILWALYITLYKFLFDPQTRCKVNNIPTFGKRKRVHKLSISRGPKPNNCKWKIKVFAVLFRTETKIYSTKPIRFFLSAFENSEEKTEVGGREQCASHLGSYRIGI